MKQERLKEGQFYHIYNRGNNRRDLFLEPAHYEHFLALYDKFISPVAETLAWVLMPNHFHMVVRIKENVVYKYSNPYQFNAVRSIDADPEGTGRLPNEATKGDLSACTTPDNVGPKGKNEKGGDSFNADRSGDAVRLTNETTGRDLSASASWRTGNIEQKVISNSWFEEHKWETVEMELFNDAGKPKKPVPHRHFGHLFNAYARYFNKRTDGKGNLFERPFKRKLIHNEDYLKQVILYVHSNPIHHGFCNHLLEYPWSSYITCVSKKPTKLKRGSVLKLFNELDNFKEHHNQQINLEKIEKYLKLDEVDNTTELANSFNADRSKDAVRLQDKTTKGDLTASAGWRTGNVERKLVGDEVQNPLNAVRSIDADPEGTGRLTKEVTEADLTASARPVNVGKVTAQDTRRLGDRLGNTLGDKQTKTNLKKMN
jgi:REP element-mobilizing transposase RayT